MRSAAQRLVRRLASASAELYVPGQHARRALARVGNPAVSELAQLWKQNTRSRGLATVRRLT